MKNKLFHKDFTLMIIGQIISIFGNSILRFAISLYVLDLTGSAAIFAGILAISMLPTILLSPLGGMIADRVNRRNIMVILDFTTSFLITIFIFLIGSDQIITIIAILMVCLSLIQSFYQPSVQASIPSITTSENLVTANSIVVQINALANLLGPILGATLYSFLGLFPIACISALCFAFSAILELFLHIPFIKQVRNGTLLETVKHDFQIAINFVVRKNPALLRILLAVAGLNLFFSSFFMVGMPFIIKIQLGLSSQLYGFAESSLAIGMIIGSLFTAKFSSKLTIYTSHRLLLLSSISLIPMALSLLSFEYVYVTYGIIIASILFGMCFATIFNVLAQSFLQIQTPPEILGKVASFVSTIAMCSYPIGQSLYGMLFEFFASHSYVIILFASFLCILIALYVKKALVILKKEVIYENSKTA